MSLLDYSFVIALSCALLFLLLSLFYLIATFLTRKKLKPLKRRPPKNKQKRKRFLVKRRKLEKQKKKQRNLALFFMLLMVLTAGTAFYARYYQMTNLEAGDSEAIVQSYYLLDDVETQLTNIQKGENPEKSIKNLREVASRLASYGARRAYTGLNEEGQKDLNRYFSMLKDLGVNLNGQTVETLEAPGSLDGYFSDIKKVKENQSQVFKEFQVNEAALKQQK